ncbi:MAG: hypothetical protein PHX14_03625 [Syntrophomonadaceae bacterium]|nr:hypothetical protein [Syntrophomonadaceae bacterium]
MMIATFSLSPAGAKRLIARGLINEPGFQRAMTHGRMIIGVGTTNSYIAEELGFISADEKPRFAAGIVSGGVPCVTDADTRFANLCLENGQLKEVSWEEFIIDFGRDDVFVKGANAFDANGNAGVLVANPMGGTIGGSFGVLAARGSKLLVPVGHEKMIPSCTAAAQMMGINRLDYSLGQRCGLALLPAGFAWIYTEIDALKTLFGVAATIVAAGGVNGSEGSVMVAIDGPNDTVKDALALARTLLKEKPLSVPRQSCKECWAGANCVFKNNVLPLKSPE